MAASASQSTSPLTRRKWTRKPSTSYEFRRTLSSPSLEAARCAGVGVAASSLVVLELSAPSREAKFRWTRGGQGCWQPAEDGGTAGEGIVSPMGRNEQGRREPHEVRRAGTGAATSKLVVEALAARRKVRSPPSEDGGATREAVVRSTMRGGDAVMACRNLDAAWRHTDGRCPPRTKARRAWAKAAPQTGAGGWVKGP